MKNLLLLAVIVLGTLTAQAQRVEVGITGVNNYDGEWSTFEDYSSILIIDYDKEYIEYFYDGETVKVELGKKVKQDRLTVESEDGTVYEVFEYSQVGKFKGNKVEVIAQEPVNPDEDDFASLVTIYFNDTNGVSLETTSLR